MNDEKQGGIKSETILICIAIFMFAAVVGYNAFYTPNVSETIEFSGNVTRERISSYKVDSDSKDENKSLDSLINLNPASESELTKLDGIGPAMAKRIIEYRESYGGFSNIEEIKNVKGIGEKLFEKIKTNICV